MSCTSGRNIGELRDIIFDVASQVRENTGTHMFAYMCMSMYMCRYCLNGTFGGVTKSGSHG